MSGEVPTEVAQIIAEVRSLRKGRGLQAGDFEQRLGPLLSELASGPPQADRRDRELLHLAGR